MATRFLPLRSALLPKSSFSPHSLFVFPMRRVPQIVTANLGFPPHVLSTSTSSYSVFAFLVNTRQECCIMLILLPSSPSFTIVDEGGKEGLAIIFLEGF